MSQDTSTSSAPPPPAPSAEKKALIDAFDTVLKRQADERDANQREAEARRRARAASRPLLAASAAILLVVGTYLGVMRPTWVFAPRPSPESLAVKEASLRISIANAAKHVEQFRQQTGRLPESLTEAGARGGVLVYSRIGATEYRIGGENGLTHVTYAANESLAGFLGNSYEIIARRPR